MTQKIIQRSELSDEQWLALRRKGIGGSQVAAILGCSPWAGAFEVYGEIVEGIRQEETTTMRRGKLLEPVVSQIFTDETGLEVTPSVMAWHPEHDWMIANPDNIVPAEKSGLEIKTSTPWAKDDWGKYHPGVYTDAVPVHYVFQCAAYMAVMDCDTWYVCVMFSRDDVRIYKLHRDRQTEERMIEKLGCFWHENIEPRVQPSLDQAKRLSEYVKERFPLDKEPLRQAEDDELPALEILRECHDLSKIAKTRLEVAKVGVQMMIGEAAGIEYEDGKVTWKKTKDQEKTNWEGVATEQAAFVPADDHERIVREHTTTTPGSRRFLTPRGWGSNRLVTNVKLLRED